MTARGLKSDPLQLLREAAEVTPPEGAQVRVGARLMSVGAVAGLGSGRPGPAGSAVSAPAPSGSVLRVLGERFVRWSVVPLGIGVAIGASGQALLAPRALQPQPSLPSASKVLPATSVGLVARSEEASQELTPSVAAPSAQVVRRTLADERALLDRARKQLASGEPARALTFLEQHAQGFPRGQLAEEREAMWVNVLVRLGRKSEAKTRGAAFAARFPNSLMSTSVAAALRAAEVAD